MLSGKISRKWAIWRKIGLMLSDKLPAGIVTILAADHG
jgi:hypothetical protein